MGVLWGSPHACQSGEKGMRQGGRLSRRGVSSRLPNFQGLKSAEPPSMLEVVIQALRTLETWCVGRREIHPAPDGHQAAGAG